MWSLLKIELYKIFKRPELILLLAPLRLSFFFSRAGLRFDGKSYLDLMLSNIDDAFDFDDSFKDRLLNGYFICFGILNILLIQMPLLVALVAGDAIAGEANMGTLRLALIRPVSRHNTCL